MPLCKHDNGNHLVKIGTHLYPDTGIHKWGKSGLMMPVRKGRDVCAGGIWRPNPKFDFKAGAWTALGFLVFAGAQQNTALQFSGIVPGPVQGR